MEILRDGISINRVPPDGFAPPNPVRLAGCHGNQAEFPPADVYEVILDFTGEIEIDESNTIVSQLYASHSVGGRFHKLDGVI